MGYNALSMSGDPGDVEQFSQLIRANMQFYAMKNDYETTPEETAHFTRRHLATAIRKKPYNVMMVIGGYNEITKKPSLHYLGQYASCVPVPFASHGYGAMFTNSLLDRWYRPDLSYEEAVELFKKVVAELQRRFIVNLPTFKLKKVDADGVTDMGWLKLSKEMKITDHVSSSGADAVMASS